MQGLQMSLPQRHATEEKQCGEPALHIFFITHQGRNMERQDVTACNPSKC